MKYSITSTLLSFIILLFFSGNLYCQEKPVESDELDQLFSNQQELSIKLGYSQKLLKKNTLDSIYTVSDLSFLNDDGSWETIQVKLKARGNYRREVCYFPPVKLKIKKSAAKSTVFEGHKKLKVVLPCKKEKAANDAVMKEYLTYKFFEFLSPYYFKTRLIHIDFTEEKGKKVNNFVLLGFLIEDISHVAKRHNANSINRFIHPQGQEAVTSVRNALFQYMIGNVDFSTGYQHNQKLLYINKRVITVPYDFDMSGFVDPSYGVLPNLEGADLGLQNIRQRLYRGFVREENIMQDVRKEFIENKIGINTIMEDHKSKFNNPKEFISAQKYLDGFYKVIENDKRFNNEIIKKSRVK